MPAVGNSMVSKACRWTVVVPLFLHLALAADKYIEDTDRFPGWKGELPHMKHGQPGEPDSVELAFGEHGKVISLILNRVAPLVEAGQTYTLRICFSTGN